MAIIYQKDKNAIKFIKDFYKQITNKVPSDPQVDSILANFDGNYDSMIRGMYVNLLGKSPSDSQVNQVVNRYLLKKKIFGKWFIRFGNWRIGIIGNKKTV
jgi:hypothetical protein